MAERPNDLVVHPLREIQAMLADHTRRFEAIDGRFDSLELGVKAFRESAVTALGPLETTRT